MNKIALIGYGWVGKSMYELFPKSVVYDPSLAGEVLYFKNILRSKITDNKEEVNNCDVAFIGVPTPLSESGKLDTSIVEECVEWCQCPLIVIRSTVNPGDCENWSRKYNKDIVFQPEYLGETPNHPLMEAKARPFLILGGSKRNTNKLIEIYATVYNANVTIRQVSLLEAEIIKLTENRAIAFKVAQCQELYDVCQLSGVDYYTIRDAVYGDDPRFNLWWTFIYPKKRGFNSSKCLRKDVPAWCAWCESLGYNPEVTKLLVKKSNDYEKLNK